MELKGKTIVVTGATGDLGGAVTAALTAHGADCRPLSLRGLPGEDAVAAFYRNLPGLWASVHVAGGFSMAPVEETSWRVYYEGETFTLQGALRAILENSVAFHIWFLYMILGLYLVTPLLWVFTRTAGVRDYLYFLGIWMLAVCLPPFLEQFFGISLADFWVIVIGFSGYYLAGYFFSRIDLSKQHIRRAGIIYILSLLITIFGTYWLLRQSSVYNPYFYDYLSPNVIVMSLAAYLLLRCLPYEQIYQVF